METTMEIDKPSEAKALPSTAPIIDDESAKKQIEDSYQRVIKEQDSEQDSEQTIKQAIIREQEKLADAAIRSVAQKYGKAKKEALVAADKRISRRLLLALRSEKLTCVCPETGIVSLLEVPAIPDFALTYSHPLSNLANCRGMAQRGIGYLRKLDTQTLAGILIVLAADYELIKFDPDASGARKNAILRTAGKDTLIDAILIIEFRIHSKNADSVPHLSLTQGAYSEDEGIRLHNYLALLTEAIRTPDTSIYDENAPPKKIGRPVYIRDVQEKERKLSFMARQELASAKKSLKEDAKTAKALASNLVTNEIAKPGLKPFINQLFADDGFAFLEVDQSLVDMLVNQKLAGMNHKDAIALIEILKKNRSILKKEITEEDDPVPGTEPAVAESDSENLDEVEDSPSSEVSSLETEDELEDSAPIREQEEQKEQEPPAGLSTIERILWKKKYQASVAVSKASTFKQTNIPSNHTYVPSAEKQKYGKD